MDENDLFRQWESGKRSRNFRRLLAPIVTEHEFRRQFGHPSSYAFVRIEAAPADSLAFRSVASWPEYFTAEDVRHIESAVAEGLLDVLVTQVDPYRGCSLTLTEARYDPVGSSFAAFRAAAMKAAEQLVHDGAWEMVVYRTPAR